MAEVTARKRGSKWEYRFEGISVDGKRKQYSKSGFRTKKEAMTAGTEAFSFSPFSGISECSQMFLFSFYNVKN